MEQMTVKELYKLVQAEMKKGNGDKLIVISDDNEGNGYHGMFFGFTSKDLEYLQDDIYDSITNDIDKIIVLG